jgi:hypothetical protein
MPLWNRCAFAQPSPICRDNALLRLVYLKVPAGSRAERLRGD